MLNDFKPDDWPHDYSHPNAIASMFAKVEDQLDEIEKRLDVMEENLSTMASTTAIYTPVEEPVEPTSHDSQDKSAGTGIWLFGSAIAIALSWSRNASILYCIGHGLASWIYVIYFAFTR